VTKDEFCGRLAAANAVALADAQEDDRRRIEATAILAPCPSCGTAVTGRWREVARHRRCAELSIPGLRALLNAAVVARIPGWEAELSALGGHQ
jgi:hypothetical protein